MLIEITILRYDKCILYILWNLVEGQVVGIMITFEFCQNLAIGIINKTCSEDLKVSSEEAAIIFFASACHLSSVLPYLK